MLSDDLIKSVRYLISVRKGDVGRLNYILNTLTQGKSLFPSDRKYVNFLISMYLNSEKKREIGVSARTDDVEKLKMELKSVKDRLEKYEKRGYEKPIGRKAIFFFVTIFVGWHTVIQIINGTLSEGMKIFQNTQELSPYVFPLFQLKSIIPSQYVMYVDQGILFGWAAMMFAWLIIGIVYLVKFIRSKHRR